jgi:hypothetical protein
VSIVHWNKIGQIYKGTEAQAAGQTHGMVPIARHRSYGVYDIYYTVRDKLGRGSIFFAKFDIDKLKWISSPKLGLGVGDIGTFDDNGCVTASIVKTHLGEEYFYYSGVNVRNTVPFSSNSGVALIADDGTLRRLYNGPVIDRNHIEPHFSAMPYVIHDGQFKAWYLSGARWEKINDGLKHFYNIKYAESTDGINWIQNGVVAIDFANQYEYAIARPCVVKMAEDRYAMWYCYRGKALINSYRIGYAESSDGISWKRLDSQVGIDVSDQGWDSEMICYPFVFKHDESLFMMYNGNDYGKSGFGLAVLDK